MGLIIKWGFFGCDTYIQSVMFLLDYGFQSNWDKTRTWPACSIMPLIFLIL